MSPVSSTAEPTFSYKVGGSLACNHPTYVERRADRELLSQLKAGKFCYIFNCRQMGKSSLRIRAMHRLITPRISLAQSQQCGSACQNVTGDRIRTATVKCRASSRISVKS